ncbi:serine hydrolase [Blastococcus sp. URHD0036]|uniref:serine hydrolase domain-containing protein n=1 Tax=Blastococcus sp. URHD0036 TaxID=1380356 RepID=UPI000496831A|nr:serine hydrolase domain-containing protein [Blastococcus sp. URHD0036]
MPALPTDPVEQLRRRAEQEVAAGNIPSCQFALARDGEVLVQETIGAPDSSRYTIFSATKPIVASVIWQLIAEGELDPAEPVSTWWPGFAQNGKDGVTLDHLLLHTAGFPHAQLDWSTMGDREARVKQMEAWTLISAPGSSYVYHGLSAHWVLAELITLRTGLDHRAAVRERVLDPLGLDRLELGVPPERGHDVRPLQLIGRQLSRAEFAESLGLDFEIPEGALVDLPPFNEPEARAAGVPGAGAVSDARSLALFHQALLHNTSRLWDPAVLADVTGNVRNRLPDAFGIPAMRTRGLETSGDGPGAAARIGMGSTSPGTFGHPGAAGQLAWTDPANGLTFVFLTDGADQNPAQEFQRSIDLCRLAAACGSV